MAQPTLGASSAVADSLVQSLFSVPLTEALLLERLLLGGVVRD